MLKLYSSVTFCVFSRAYYSKQIRSLFLTLFISLAVIYPTGAYAQLTEQQLNATLAIINHLLLDDVDQQTLPPETTFELELNQLNIQTFGVSNELSAGFESQGQDIELCFFLSSQQLLQSAVSLSINGAQVQAVKAGENCYSITQTSQQNFNTVQFSVTGAVNASINQISIEPTQQNKLGLASLTRSSWDQKSVRKVLRIFAFGGHATDQQINIWANMNPELAIAEMLNFDEHNLKLSPIAPQDNYQQTATEFGKYTDFVTNYLSNPNANTPIDANRRDRVGLDGYAFDRSFAYMVLTRGLNPFRQMIGFWETNYHLAVNLDSDVDEGDIVEFYDVIMQAHESGVPYQRVLATAAKAAAPAEQYGHKDNQWINEICFCNDDFAREIHQLYFGIFGEGDEDHHENVTIPNTANMLTGMRTSIGSGRNKQELNRVEPFLEEHHLGPLQILRQTITGAGPFEKIDALVEHSIEHPDSLKNLPIMIISGLADDNLSEQSKGQLRAAWASMGNNKQFLEFVRAYAISDLFHGPEQLKYMTTFTRTYYIANKTNLENIEALRQGEDVGRPLERLVRDEDVAVFRPLNNVFGGQTSLEASDSSAIFEQNYNSSSRSQYQWNNMASCDNCDQGQPWNKDWSTVLPQSANGQYRVDDAARWLWNHMTGSLDNYTQVERAHLVAILGSAYANNQRFYMDLSLFLCLYNDRRSVNQSPNDLNTLLSRAFSHCAFNDNDGYDDNELRWLMKNYTADELNGDDTVSSTFNPAITDGVLPDLINALGNQVLAFESDNGEIVKNANRRVQFALAFIAGTPYMFVEAGE